MAIVTMAGLPTGSSYILNVLGFSNPANWISGLMLTSLLGILVASSIGGVIIAGFFGRTPSESFVIAPLLTGFLVFFIVDMSSLVIYLNTFTDMAWIGSIFTIFFAAITGGYIIALVQFWRGNDI